MTPWLDDVEIAALCRPLVRSAARVRYLRDKLHLHVTTKPNGEPVVMRSELERVLGAARVDAGGQAHDGGTEPNVTALQDWAKRRKHGGTQTQGR